jgi:hypothetical protein
MIKDVQTNPGDMKEFKGFRRFGHSIKITSMMMLKTK